MAKIGKKSGMMSEIMKENQNDETLASMVKSFRSNNILANVINTQQIIGSNIAQNHSSSQ